MKKKLYPRTAIRLANSNKNIVHVPPHLKPMQFGRYPPDNAVIFERWYMDSWNAKDETERTYLPIQWTALYCNNGFGNQPIIHSIQKFIETLDKGKKYYTIVQYDDGILNDLSGLDIKVMAMSIQSDFNLPLLCTPHKFNFRPKDIEKKYYASFIGSLTHPIRANIIDQLKGNPDYYISTDHHSLYSYCQIFAQSKYVLCPRGYGLNSFRIQEAIDFGAIPVYISDEFVYPYNMPTFVFGPQLSPDADINAALKYFDETEMIKITKTIIEKNKSLYTYAGCKMEILNYLRNEKQDGNEKS